MQNIYTPQPTYCIRLALNTLSFAQNEDNYNSPKKKKKKNYNTQTWPEKQKETDKTTCITHNLNAPMTFFLISA